MAEKIKQLVIALGAKEYELSGGGSLTPGESIPQDTVDSAAIKDGSIQSQDLSDEVKDKIQKTYDQQGETLYMDFDTKEATPAIDGDGEVDDDL